MQGGVGGVSPYGGEKNGIVHSAGKGMTAGGGYLPVDSGNMRSRYGLCDADCRPHRLAVRSEVVAATSGSGFAVEKEKEGVGGRSVVVVEGSWGQDPGGKRRRRPWGRGAVRSGQGRTGLDWTVTESLASRHDRELPMMRRKKPKPCDKKYRGWLMSSTPRDEVPCSWAHREIFDSGRL